MFAGTARVACCRILNIMHILWQFLVHVDAAHGTAHGSECQAIRVRWIETHHNTRERTHNATVCCVMSNSRTSQSRGLHLCMIDGQRKRQASAFDPQAVNAAGPICDKQTAISRPATLQAPHCGRSEGMSAVMSCPARRIAAAGTARGCFCGSGAVYSARYAHCNHVGESIRRSGAQVKIQNLSIRVELCLGSGKRGCENTCSTACPGSAESALALRVTQWQQRDLHLIWPAAFLAHADASLRRPSAVISLLHTRKALLIHFCISSVVRSPVNFAKSAIVLGEAPLVLGRIETPVDTGTKPQTRFLSFVSFEEAQSPLPSAAGVDMGN